MSENVCPNCGAALPAESVNIAEGVALCPECGRLSRLSEVVERTRPVAEVLANPPRGCSITERGSEIAIQASCRSFGGFFGLLFVCLFWNGIVSVFVLIAVAGLYSNLVGPIPEWFPAPPMNDPMGLGMTVFLCLFLVPFVVIGMGMFGALALSALGTTRVLIGQREASVATGIGFVSWRRRFDPQQVRKVVLDNSARDKYNRPMGKRIVIHADRTITFGSSLPEERRDWLHAVLREMLVDPDPERQRDLVLMASRGWRSFDEL